MESTPRIIVLTEDARLRRWALDWDLPGLQLQFYDDASEALAAAREEEVWLFLWDARSHGGPLEGVLRRIQGLPAVPEPLVVLEPDDARELPGEMRVEPDEQALAEQVDRLLRLQRVRRSGGIVGQSPAVRELIVTIAQIAPLEVPVLVQGESGTGKELVARALHAGSRRAQGPFVSINVGSLAESLLESELFGHEKGAFTGAVNRHAGVFERADGGTLFLDEVGEMPPAMQVKLLRVLESREFQRVGGAETLRTDIRLVTATHRRLEEGIERGLFRSDLYYRLKVVRIDLPPLREREEDIPLLAQHFLAQANETHGLRRRGFTREAMEWMMRYRWPGNVRELRNVVQSMAVMGRGEYLGREDLPPDLTQDAQEGRPLPATYGPGRAEGTQDPLLAHTLMALLNDMKEVLRRLERLEARLGGVPGAGAARSWGEAADLAEVTPVGADLPQDLEGAEKAMIQAALRHFRGNRRKAAEQLGISERTLYRKLKRYGLG
jgi:DNA-binding NtrC family response regulator